MGFVAIEDLQGTIELVIFPGIWAKFSDLIVPDGIILVEGRTDTSSAEPKVLVDQITTDFSMTVPLDTVSNHLQKQQNSKAVKQQNSAPANEKQRRSDRTAGQDLSVEEEYPSSIFEDLPKADEEEPPMPDPPPDWDLYAPAEASLVVIAASMFAGGGGDSQPAPEPSQSLEPVIEAVHSGEAPLTSVEISPVFVEPLIETAIKTSIEMPADRPIVLPPFLVPPAVAGGSELVQMVTVVMRASGDKTRDVLRLRRIHGTVMSFPGNDRFAFHVFERNRGYLLEFPNFTTGVCSDLIAKLQFLVGSENVRVEPITFQ